jgi:hypothetical protein
MRRCLRLAIVTAILLAVPITEAATTGLIPFEARNPPSDATRPTDQAGSAAPAQNGNLVVSDFDGERIEIRSGLSLWVFADEQFGGTSEARPTLVHPGASASRGALRISFRLTEDFANPFAGVWAMIGPEGLATDLSAYRGVRFYARSKNEGAFTAGVVRFPGQVKRYMAPLETRPEWTLIELPFDKFREVTPAGAPTAGTPPLVAHDVTSIGFSVAPKLRGQFELDIDHIEFYR